ncbi:MAG: ATP synthase F1 subunit gamma [Elusimicrobiaceae bacterium]|nr:ATP synthase F1 subunit gamma [Elusimicrobiaceae bacterium]
MESLRDIRGNIKSISATRQIMVTMKMIASARVKKAQRAIESSRPFAVKMRDMMDTLHAELAERDDTLAASPVRWFCEHRPVTGKETVGLILITADKGLCGAFNTNLLRMTADWLRANRGKRIRAFAVGKKGRDFLRRLRGLDLELVHESIGIFPKVSFANAELLGEALDCDYEKNSISGVTAIYTDFKTMLSQVARREELLPVSAGQEEPAGRRDDFLFEPGKQAVFESLVPRYVKAQLYRMMLESQAAELAARMNAMESAGQNAGGIIDALTLKLNRTRQASITTELTEIVSGAEALKS